MPDYGLGDKVVLITGGNTGIGAATARAFGDQGARVGIAYLHFAERASALVADLMAAGRPATAYQIDLGDVTALSGLLDHVEQALGPVDILINNAAHSERDGWVTLTAATLDRHYQVNTRATALLTTEFARRFQAHHRPAPPAPADIVPPIAPAGGSPPAVYAPWGRVINLTSGQFVGPMPGELAYIASKGAIEALTITLAAELVPVGITVNAVDPGITDTGWITDELRASLLPRMPFGRFGQPEDAARLILFLASSQAGWITGQVIRSRGGS